MVTNFSYPWCFAGALRALKLRYHTLKREINLSDRLSTWQIEMSVFLTFLSKKQPIKNWHSLLSHMADRETPLPLPKNLCGRTDERSYAYVIKNFLGLMGYQIFLPMVLRWRASRAEAPLQSKLTCAIAEKTHLFSTNRQLSTFEISKTQSEYMQY